MKKYRIRQIKSGIGRTKRQKLTLQALGLRRMHHSIEVVGTPQIVGMIGKVKHLLSVEEI